MGANYGDYDTSPDQLRPGVQLSGPTPRQRPRQRPRPRPSPWPTPGLRWRPGYDQDQELSLRHQDFGLSFIQAAMTDSWVATVKGSTFLELWQVQIFDFCAGWVTNLTMWVTWCDLGPRGLGRFSGPQTDPVEVKWCIPTEGESSGNIQQQVRGTGVGVQWCDPGQWVARARVGLSIQTFLFSHTHTHIYWATNI